MPGQGQERIDMSRREEILEKVKSIPALPTVATKAIQLLRDPEVDIKDVVQMIEYDQGLTSNVLRLANSAYFAGPRTIGSLRDALVRLGMNRIFQLVVTSAISPFARQPVKGYDLAPGELLEQSVAVAVGAEELAPMVGVRPPVHTFTAGLLHDLGKIILSTFVEVDAAPITNLAYREKVSFELAEAQVLGIDHAEAGAALLEEWNLPESIVEAVRWHHQPDSAPGDKLVVDLVHVADNLLTESGVGVGIDGLNYQLSPGAVSRLQLRTSTAEKVVYTMLTSVEDLRPVLSA